MIKKKNKAQEEIVGFVLIVLLIAVIGLVLLFFSLNGSSKEVSRESKIINSFISSLMRQTTDCKIGGIRRDVSYLVRRCYIGGNCDNGVGVCDYLNETLEKIVDNSFLVSETSPVRSYNLRIFSETNSNVLELSKIAEGGCSGVRSYSERAISGGKEDITLRFEICRIG
jgi:hypothetical protein